MLSLCKGKSLFCGSTCWSTWRWRVLKSAINWFRNSLSLLLPPPPSGGECDKANVEKHKPVKPYNSALVLELLFGGRGCWVLNSGPCTCPVNDVPLSSSSYCSDVDPEAKAPTAWPSLAFAKVNWPQSSTHIQFLGHTNSFDLHK